MVLLMFLISKVTKLNHIKPTIGSFKTPPCKPEFGRKLSAKPTSVAQLLHVSPPRKWWVEVPYLRLDQALDPPRTCWASAKPSRPMDAVSNKWCQVFCCQEEGVNKHHNMSMIEWALTSVSCDDHIPGWATNMKTIVTSVPSPYTAKQLLFPLSH